MTQPTDSSLHPTLPAQRWQAYRVLWPLLLLIGLEILVFSLAALERDTEPTPLSLLTAAIVLLTGVTPALLRPSQASSLFGCFAVLLAALLWRVPPESPTPYQPFAMIIDVPSASSVRVLLANGAFLAPLALHIAARFPQRSAISGRIIVGAYALTTALLLIVFAIPSSAPRWSAMALQITFSAMQLAAVWLLIHHSRTIGAQSGRTAQQARLLLAAIMIAEAPLLLRVVGQLFDLHVPYDIILGAQIALPIGIGYAILRHDLFQIDNVLRRALAYTVLSAALLAIYFGLTTILAVVLKVFVPTFPWLAAALGLFVSAAAFAPLRTRAQAWIDQLLYPERRLFQQVLGEAHAALTQALLREAVIALLAEELPRRIGAAGAALLFDSSEQPLDTESERAWRAPLIVGGRVLGHYWLGPRRSGLPYAADEQKQLQTLTQQAALALAYAETFDHLADVNRELEERVAMRTAHLLAQQRELAAVAERQRIARDLHDSVKQTLFSLGLGLRVVRQLLKTDPAAAQQMLNTQEAMAIQAQAEMGTLLAHLRAPRDGARDLVQLLSSYCAELEQQQQLYVTLDTPPALVLPAGHSSELLLIAREALHNVLKHSGGNTATLTLCEDDSRVEMQIADQGRGFAPDSPQSRNGHGIGGMRERAVALGGTLAICAEPGQGTTITIQLTRTR